MSGQIQWTVGLVLAGLFAIAIIGFAINYANDNDTAVSLSEDEEVTGVYTDVSANLESFRSDLASKSSGLLNSSIDSQSGTIESGGSFSGGISDITLGTENIIRVGYTKIFGSSGGLVIFLNVLLVVLGSITLLYFWKTWRGGLPD